MSAQLLNNARILLPGEGTCSGSILLRDGRISALNPTTVSSEVGVVDCCNRLLTPGLIDLHTHGIGSHAYHYARSLEDFASAARFLPRFGTTCVIPTVVPPAEPEFLRPLGEWMESLPVDGGTSMPGLHLEGPFVAVGGAACPTLPGDLRLLEEILRACRGRTLIMSVSPEQRNILPVIGRLREARILPFITHTAATVEQTEAAISAGACHATHFYDVFPMPAETDPGVRPVGAVEAILANPQVSVDFIADGVHVHPTAIRATVAAKGWEKVLLITDSNVGAGLPPGEHETPWGYRVRVEAGGAARHATLGFLAGSALTMDVGIRNLLRWLPLPPEQVWAMGTLNPARLLGLTRKGQIAPGADADLVLWDEDLKVVKTWVGGRCCFDREEVA